MRANLCIAIVAVLVSFPALARPAGQSDSDRAAAVEAGRKAAIAALNFQQGDAAGFDRARDNFTPDGWKAFMRHMDGYVDRNGAPTFTSSFVAKRDATVLGESNGILRFRIPGTLTQTNKIGTTTYRRAAIEVNVLRDSSGEKPIKIQHLEQIICFGTSTACD